MAKEYLSSNRHQAYLLPPSIDERTFSSLHCRDSQRVRLIKYSQRLWWTKLSVLMAVVSPRGLEPRAIP